MSIKYKAGFEFRGKHRRPSIPPDATDPPLHKKLSRRPYQLRFFDELKDEALGFIIAPPASGKSLVMSALVYEKLIREPKRKAILVVPQTQIGHGFEAQYIDIPGRGEILFDPLRKNKAHRPGEEKSKLGAFRRFLKQEPTSAVNDRIFICTHQLLNNAHKKFPELFRRLFVVIDEAHHSQTDETETVANCLGKTITSLIKAVETTYDRRL